MGCARSSRIKLLHCPGENDLLGLLQRMALWHLHVHRLLLRRTDQSQNHHAVIPTDLIPRRLTPELVTASFVASRSLWHRRPRRWWRRASSPARSTPSVAYASLLRRMRIHSTPRPTADLP